MRTASRTSISAFGVVVSIAGIEHGIGEILQGNHAPVGMMIESWPGSPFFRMLAGEPAMTIIPNLLVTGLLAIFTTLIFLLLSTVWISKKFAGWVMILAASCHAAVWSGNEPADPGNHPERGHDNHEYPSRKLPSQHPTRFQQLRAKLWPGALIFSLASWLVVLPGLPLLDYFGDVNSPALVVVVVLLAIGTLLLTLNFARIRDAVYASRITEFTL